jgi:uncharacterized protein YjbJ (UPF0337 family)
MNKDQVKGRVEEAKGKVKEVTGNVIGNKKLETEGNIEKNLGKGQAGYGDAKEDLKDSVRKP